MAKSINRAAAPSSTPSPYPRTTSWQPPVLTQAVMIFTLYLLYCLLGAVWIVWELKQITYLRNPIQIQSQQHWLPSLKLTPDLTVPLMAVMLLIAVHVTLQLVVRCILNTRIFTVEEKRQHGVLPRVYRGNPVVALDELLERDNRQRKRENGYSDRMMVRLLERYIDLPPLSYVSPYMRMNLPPPMTPDAPDCVSISTTLTRRPKKHISVKTLEEGLLWVWLQCRRIQRKKRQEAEPPLPLYNATLPTAYESMEMLEVPATLQAPYAVSRYYQEGFDEVNLQGEDQA